MKYRPRLISCPLAAGLLLVCTQPAFATKIDPIPWDELVLGADLVGIVECQTAGGIVARYRVLESWKGPKAGTLVTIRQAVNYWEPQFPISLCGQRYLVTAFRSTTPNNIVSTTSGGAVPLWWRIIPTDYSVPLFQGMTLHTPADKKDPDFLKQRKATLALVALKPADQETAYLKGCRRPLP